MRTREQTDPMLRAVAEKDLAEREAQRPRDWRVSTLDSISVARRRVRTDSQKRLEHEKEESAPLARPLANSNLNSEAFVFSQYKPASQFAATFSRPHSL